MPTERARAKPRTPATCVCLLALWLFWPSWRFWRMRQAQATAARRQAAMWSTTQVVSQSTVFELSRLCALTGLLSCCGQDCAECLDTSTVCMQCSVADCCRLAATAGPLQGLPKVGQRTFCEPAQAASPQGFALCMRVAGWWKLELDGRT